MPIVAAECYTRAVVRKERRCWTAGALPRQAVGVAWASALLAVGCGDDSGQQAGTLNVGTGSCVDVSHVDEMQRDDLEVIGTGFEADEGHMIRIVVTHGEPTYGLGEAPIERGSFDIFLPGVLGDYTGIAVHIDSVRNNACDPDEEFIWQMTTGPASARGPAFSETGGRTVWEVTPDTLWVFEQVGPCSLNGIFDLTTTLPCTD
jgi:hypothetical protein